MDLDDYQSAAQATDQKPGREGDAIVVPLLGMAGEAGDLLTAYKKRLRDGPAYTAFEDRIAEELGDILWYVANLASKFDLSLSRIAEANLAKTGTRWGNRPEREPDPTDPLLFDAAYPSHEQFPREMTAEVTETIDETGMAIVRLKINGSPVGDPLNDNARIDDGYRFHDVLHLAHVATLGWSPTMRRLMKRKRKSDPRVDHAEDGARATIVDEGVVEMIFDYARRHSFLEGVDRIDYELLRAIKQRTSGLEVSARSVAEWERAILESYRLWRAIRANGGGRFRLDLLKRRIELLD
ncbi:MAG: nucleoside triphosphate pyrophosphohydrolase family protein [Pseudomonadota bacterium]